ncbi:hypothetical protein HPB52_009618 [Rhipicephalus sanguineus]|uniref:Selenocysteine lyase n=1 Tax=Rhipicephalus sanguineus TaxID=34632 RepID=A0A9D4PWG7_RHISA|nr:hypothetical protein HPB52_009618 [Rhipicephalus sanguineus]
MAEHTTWTASPALRKTRNTGTSPPVHGRRAALLPRETARVFKHHFIDILRGLLNNWVAGKTENTCLKLLFVYLDYNATAPVEEEVQKSIIYALQVAWGNPTSNHDGDLTVVPVSKVTGTVSAEEVITAIRPNTCFVTIMLAKQRDGIIQPVNTIGTLLKDVNQQRKKHSLPEVLFHTDAAQALGKVAVNVDDLKVDYLTIAGHKFYGPRTGALYFRDSKPLYPLLFGAGQERGLRPGTPNTCMIAGVGTAAMLVAKNLGTYHQLMKDSRDYLEEKLKSLQVGTLLHWVGCSDSLFAVVEPSPDKMQYEQNS